MYPHASIVHWKVLLREINSFRGVDVTDRRLEEKKTDKKPDNADGKKTADGDGKKIDGSYKTKEEPKVDFSSFKGVEMKSDKSLVSFGLKKTLLPTTCIGAPARTRDRLFTILQEKLVMSNCSDLPRVCYLYMAL